MFWSNSPRFQVVVTSNLFGDIITDLGAAIAGGMGLAAGANINPERRYPRCSSRYTVRRRISPGRARANRWSVIWSASQMLDFFGHEDWGKRVIDAIERVLVQGPHAGHVRNRKNQSGR